MRITYLARHDSGHNDDEGAVVHALRELGHKVSPVREERAGNAHRLSCDLLLVNKFAEVDVLERFKGRCVRAFWYWDRVADPDPTLAARNAARQAWMDAVTPHVEIGFLTDGDFAAKDTSGKLRWLPQGADERVIGKGEVRPGDGPCAQLLLCASRRGGALREGFVDEVKATYGPRLFHAEKGWHGRALADLVARSQVVLAPDAPCGPRYWSNRVYLMLGFGAFLLHPFTRGLSRQYRHGEEAAFYRSRGELHELAARHLARPAQARLIGEAGLARTKREHTYRHRCEELLAAVKEKCP